MDHGRPPNEGVDYRAPGFVAHQEDRLLPPVTMVITDCKQACKDVHARLLKRPDYMALMYPYAGADMPFVLPSSDRAYGAQTAYAFRCAPHCAVAAPVPVPVLARGVCMPPVGACGRLGLLPTPRFHRRHLCSLDLPSGELFARALEDYTFASWHGLRLRIGEPYVLTASIDSYCPNGAPCAMRCLICVPVDAVEQKFTEYLDTLLCEKVRGRPEAQKRTRPMAWGPVNFRPPLDAVHLAGASVRSVAKDLLRAWIDHNKVLRHGVWHVAVPRMCVRLPSGANMDRNLLPYPELESAVGAGEQVVAVRVQLPVVPAAVRTASSVLSVTVPAKSQRVVVHCTHAPDVLMSEEAHNSPLFIALTRVVDAADVALTCETQLHGNIFLPRQPLRDMLRSLRARGQERRQHWKVYHCRAWCNAAAPERARDSEAHDARLHAQANCGFFDALPGEGAMLLNNIVPEQDLGL